MHCQLRKQMRKQKGWEDVMKAFEIKHIFSTVPSAVCLVVNEIPAIDATFKFN
jgi:hypothetical protein